MKIIDDTYNGAKFPIVERTYNAYYFPDNYDPDNMEEQTDDISNCEKDNCKVEIYDHANPK